MVGTCFSKTGLFLERQICSANFLKGVRRLARVVCDLGNAAHGNLGDFLLGQGWIVPDDELIECRFCDDADHVVRPEQPVEGDVEYFEVLWCPFVNGCVMGERAFHRLDHLVAG